ncbi:hypothetical protein SLS64_009515 [Diaporthe eres]|uniref:Uncharacterized protein n=1 Tax=Diaporthe eres TaxID=83184 RepID=A0ABR1P9D0_DIAER
MSSHFAKLKQELDAKQHELQKQQSTVETIEKLTKELEAQKQALAAKAAELENQQNEVKVMRKRLDTLTAVEPVISAAMHTKSSTQDVVKHVIENAIHSDHMTSSEIVQITLDTAMHANGRTRDANLEDFLIDLIIDEDSLDAAIDTAMQNFDTIDVVEHTLRFADLNGASARNVTDCFRKTMDYLHGGDGIAAESSTKTQGWYYHHSSRRLRVFKLTPQYTAVKKENVPSGPPSNATPVNKNGLRGQAADFKPLSDPHQSYDARGWQALAQSGWGNGSGGGW